MNFELGFYRTRDGSIVEVTSVRLRHYAGRLIQVSTIPITVKNLLVWDTDGNSLATDELDLMEYLKVKENGRHEGLPLETYIKKNLDTSSSER